MIYSRVIERSRRTAGEAAAVDINPDGPFTHTEMSQADIDAAAQAEAEAAGVPAWRDLWYSSLEALRREPTINNTQEDIMVQLGGVAFLHCPVRNLGELGVRKCFIA